MGNTVRPDAIGLTECVICLIDIEDKHFDTGNCDHQVCRDCLGGYFKNALKDDRYDSFIYIECPSSDCSAKYVSFEILQEIFDDEEREAWWDSAIGSKAYISNKVVCPMQDCSAIYDADTELTKKCNFTECYECHRGFCMTCQTAWHPDIIKVTEDEEAERKTLILAQKNKWKTCPRCGQIVERKYGCNTISCRCGQHFCYACGKKQCLCSNNHPEVNLRRI